MGSGVPTGPRGEVPKWTHISNSASKISSRHTADRVLPLISGFGGHLYFGPIRFAERSYRDQSGIPRPTDSGAFINVSGCI